MTDQCNITTDPVSHSPGPWEFLLGASNRQEIGAHGTICEASEGRYYIASIWADIPELKQRADANVRLIAAAPDLLALVKQYASECLDCNYGDGPTGKTPEGEPCEWCGNTRALIAKVTGEHS